MAPHGQHPSSRLNKRAHRFCQKTEIWPQQTWPGPKVVLKINGLIKRINKNIDELSQTVSIHIEFTNTDLKDGLYVNTKIPLKLNSEGFSVSRSILINDSFVYVAENNNVVGIRNVKPIYYDEDSVIISGLKDGERIISSYIPGIYKGMKIKISD